MTRRIAILGAGDLGRTLLPHVDATRDLQVVAFLDDTRRGESVMGRPVLGGFSDVEDLFSQGSFDAVVIGIGYRHLPLRQRLYEDLKGLGIPLATVVHPSCYVDPTAQVDEGAVLFPRCTIDVRARVGPNAILNVGCLIAHDVRIGAHCFLAPGVVLAGFVDVGPRAFLGVGTVVIDGVRLGEACQTGGGAVVTGDIADLMLAVGVPARPLRSRKE